MSFTIKQSKKKGIKSGLLLVFINSVYFLDNLVKNFGENDFYHLSQELNAKEKRIFHYDYLDSFENSKEAQTETDRFYNALTNRGITIKNCASSYYQTCS